MPRELTPLPVSRRRAALVGLLATLVGLLALSPGSAQANSGPESADPSAGAVLSTAPAEVTLGFGGSIDEEQSHVAVLDDAGRTVSDGEPRRAGSTRLRLPLRIGAAGDYTVAYHVTFTDGTTDTGVHRFSVGTGVPPAPLGAAALRASTDAVAAHAHRIDPFSAALLFVDGVVLAVILALLWLRPRDGRAMSLRADPRT
ncbi:copper resistance protein CopC [Micromonospora sp. KC606]|uniref:copper resistance CopC family protein n=1 Tax=Micromonospora sp. KC606 TaxID=2530379 RepID=UPI0010501351|nr:copper resistance CopC family protein [Micromonospora sp. KC606]TDC85667.1 copper resistance protein CopC [Micromonospora sp. KC606]